MRQRIPGLGAFRDTAATGLIPALLLILAAPVPALAGPSPPAVVGPLAVGPANTPFIAAARNLAEAGYVEEEYLVSGTAKIYTYVDPTADFTVLIQAADAPYTTRFLVRRPSDPRKFNGTVVFEWLNPTAGFDIDPLWQRMDDYLVEQGYAWVGLSLRTVRPDGTPFLTFWNPGRYASIHFPDLGLLYDAATQLGIWLRDTGNPANPFFGHRVRALLGAGYSQSASYLVTYANEFHEDALLPDGRNVWDGYFVSGGFGVAKALNSGTGFDHIHPSLLTVEADVPVVRLQTETEVNRPLPRTGGSWEARQEDSPTFRLYEIAGLAHQDGENFDKSFGPGSAVARDVPAALLPPPTSALCLEPTDYVSTSGPWQRAALRNLDRWVREGEAPPPGVRIVLDASNRIVRDVYGNAEGGLRIPAVEVPIGQHLPASAPIPGLPFPQNVIAAGICRLTGGFLALDPAVVASVYPQHGAYVRGVVEAVQALVNDGYLLREDAQVFITAAARSSIGRQ